jgi:hypothetical protein
VLADPDQQRLVQEAARLPVRPTLEVLEDRCLLATGLGHGLHLGHRRHSNDGLHLGQHEYHDNHGHHNGQGM